MVVLGINSAPRRMDTIQKEGQTSLLATLFCMGFACLVIGFCKFCDRIYTALMFIGMPLGYQFGSCQACL